MSEKRMYITIGLERPSSYAKFEQQFERADREGSLIREHDPLKDFKKSEKKVPRGSKVLQKVIEECKNENSK